MSETRNNFSSTFLCTFSIFPHFTKIDHKSSTRLISSARSRSAQPTNWTFFASTRNNSFLSCRHSGDAGGETVMKFAAELRQIKVDGPPRVAHLFARPLTFLPTPTHPLCFLQHDAAAKGFGDVSCNSSGAQKDDSYAGRGMEAAQGGTCVCGAATVQQLSRSSTRTDLAKMPIIHVFNHCIIIIIITFFDPR